VPLDRPARVVDLGCGPGNSTALLRERWPDAEITGIDGSEEMLAEARRQTGIRWERADIARWRPGARYDVIFSNATLQWLDDHRALFPSLVAALAPGGVLAVQMPRNFASASHRAAREVVANGPWGARLTPILRVDPVHDAVTYHRMLAPHTRALDVWETEYLHVLDGDNPVADWTRGTYLVPLISALAEAERDVFEAEYRSRVKAAYPREPNGRTLFPFRRLFIVAQT
jgi:trans-aconitate 2-methyltransferase